MTAAIQFCNEHQKIKDLEALRESEHRKARHATLAGEPFQITTDGFAPYRWAITTTLHDRITGYAQLKIYRTSQEGEDRYSPAEVSSVEMVRVFGNLAPDRICTSIGERSKCHSGWECGALLA